MINETDSFIGTAVQCENTQDLGVDQLHVQIPAMASGMPLGQTLISTGFYLRKHVRNVQK